MQDAINLQDAKNPVEGKGEVGSTPASEKMEADGETGFHVVGNAGNSRSDVKITPTQDGDLSIDGTIGSVPAHLKMSLSRRRRTTASSAASTSPGAGQPAL